MSKWMRYTARYVFTQSNVGGGIIRGNIVFPEKAVLLWCTVGPDDYSAAKAINAYLRDDVPNTIARLGTFSLDNVSATFPNEDASLYADGDGPLFKNKIDIGADQDISVLTASLAQTETLTITINALIKTTVPTTNSTGSTGTVAAASVTYSKVI